MILTQLIRILSNKAFAQPSFVPPNMNEVDVQTCPIGSINCEDDLIGTVRDAALNSSDTSLFNIFSLALFAMLAFFGVKLIIDSRKDSGAADATKSYVNALIGSVLVAGAGILTSIVTDHTQVLTVTDEPITALDNLATFVIALLLGALVLNITIQGFRFITAIDQGARDKARGNLIRGLIGSGVVGVCRPILNFVLPAATLQNEITNEIVGIANFLATIFGSMAIIGFFIAGVMLVVSVDDSLQDRARKLMITSVVALVVVVASYTLIQIFF